MMNTIAPTRLNPRETSPDYFAIINLAGVTLGHIGDNRSFPGDLVVLILSKLPVKTLLRFKAVCKPWKLLINSPVFINIHLHRKPLQQGVFPLNQGYNWKPFPFGICSVVGHCNGLICFRTNKVSLPLLVEPHGVRLYKPLRNSPLVLYNPSTREFSFLPVEYREEFSCRDYQSFGFCYFPQTQEYKLFCFISKSLGNTIDMKILTLGINTKSFRHVKDIILAGRIGHHTNGATTIGTSMFHLVDDYENAIVICYDAVEDRFSKMNVPTCSSTSHRSLGVLKNSLSMLVQPSYGASSFDIWMLITDNVSMDKSWMKYRTVGPLFGPFGESLVTFNPKNWSDRLILVRPRFNLFDYDDVDNDDDDEKKEIFHYDPYTNHVERYKVAELHFVSYVESLVSVNSICSIY